MPTSNLHVAPYVINLVEQVPHQWILDVGPGFGKYATLLREYLNTKPGRVDAVEAWAPYIDDHGLRCLYDDVYLGRAHDPVWWREPGVSVDAVHQLAAADVVLMVDVIEHMSRVDAAAVIERCRGRVVVCTPVEFFDNGPGLPPTEAHVSHWAAQDFADLAAGTRDVEYVGQEHGGWLVRFGPQAAYRPRRAVTRHRSAAV